VVWKATPILKETKMAKLIWLAGVLKAAGLRVVEEDGWAKAGNGEMGVVRGVMLHHTGAGSSAGLLRLIRDGRDDLPGPLSHLFLDRDGTFHVIAAGRCNHAGKGQWQGVTQGNTSFIGIEAANDGVDEPWPQVQLSAYVAGVAAILGSIGADPVMAVGHKEWALPRGRKVDPTFDMYEFREAVEGVMDNDLAVELPTPVDPKRAMLRKGDRGSSVKELQKLLGVSIDGNFGPKTEAAVRHYQQRNGLKADGMVGPKTWAKLLGA
jgi:N-acetyl-anhydromuramyl-L-alanine amidase AmpD